MSTKISADFCGSFDLSTDALWFSWLYSDNFIIYTFRSKLFIFLIMLWHKHFIIIVREELNIRSSHGTLVVFLQNDSGYERWGPTPERLAELALSFQAVKRPGESNATTSKWANLICNSYNKIWQGDKMTDEVLLCYDCTNMCGDAVVLVYILYYRYCNVSCT